MEIVELSPTPILPASEWVWKYWGQTIPSPVSGRDPYLGPAIGWPGGGPFDLGAKYDVSRRFGVGNRGGNVPLTVDVGPRVVKINGEVFRKGRGVVILSNLYGEFVELVYEGLGGDGGGLVPPEWEEDGWG